MFQNIYVVYPWKHLYFSSMIFNILIPFIDLNYYFSTGKKYLFTFNKFKAKKWWIARTVFWDGHSAVAGNHDISFETDRMRGLLASYEQFNQAYYVIFLLRDVIVTEHSLINCEAFILMRLARRISLLDRFRKVCQVVLKF